MSSGDFLFLIFLLTIINKCNGGAYTLYFFDYGQTLANCQHGCGAWTALFALKNPYFM